MAVSSLILNLIVRDQGSTATVGGVSKGFAALSAVLAGTGAVMGASVNKAADFDKTIRQVGAAAKVPAAGLEELSKLALQMGADTTYSAAEAAQAMLELAKGGLTDADIKGGALASTLTLAAAGGQSLADASTTMSNALNGFRLDAADAGMVAAAFAGAATASTASVDSLAQALAQVGPGAQTAGLSLQDTVGVLAAFDNNMLKGSAAGTSLKTFLTRLVPSTDAARKAMKDLGLDFTDAQGNFRPITEIAGQLQRAFGGLSEEAKTVALSDIFGADAARAASVLATEGAAGIEKYIAATKDMNAAQEMAATNTAGAAGAMEQFKGSLETLQIVVGTKLLPAVTQGLQVLTTFVNLLDNPFVLAFAGAVTALAAAIWVVNAASRAWASATTALATVQRVLGINTAATATATRGAAAAQGAAAAATTRTTIASRASTVALYAQAAAIRISAAAMVVFQNAAKAARVAVLLLATANPAFLIVAGLVAAGVALVALWKNSETFRNIVTGAFNAVKGAAQAAFGWVRSNWPLLLAILAGPFGLAVLAVVKFKDQITGAISGAFDWVKSNWPLLLAILTGPFGLAVAAVVKWRDEITGAAGNVVDAITAIPGRVGDFAGALVDKGRQLVAGLWNGFQSAISNVGTQIRNAVIRQVQIRVDAAKWLYNTGRDLLIGLWNGVQSFGGQLFGWFRDLPSTLYRLVNVAGDWMVTAGKNIVTGLWNGVVSMVGKLGELGRLIVKKVWDEVKSGFGLFSPSRRFREGGRNLGQGLALGVIDAMSKPVAAMRNMVSKVNAAGRGLRVEDFSASATFTAVTRQQNEASGAQAARQPRTAGTPDAPPRAGDDRQGLRVAAELARLFSKDVGIRLAAATPAPAAERSRPGVEVQVLASVAERFTNAARVDLAPLFDRSAVRGTDGASADSRLLPTPAGDTTTDAGRQPPVDPQAIADAVRDGLRAGRWQIDRDGFVRYIDDQLGRRQNQLARGG